MIIVPGGVVNILHLNDWVGKRTTRVIKMDEVVVTPPR